MLQDARLADWALFVSRKDAPASARASDRLLTIGRRVEYPCGVPPVRKSSAQARVMRVAPRPAPHRCESASNVRGTPARGRQKSPLRGPADCRRREDTPTTPRAFADPLASRQEAPSASAGNAGSTPPRSTTCRCAPAFRASAHCVLPAPSAGQQAGRQGQGQSLAVCAVGKTRGDSLLASTLRLTWIRAPWPSVRRGRCRTRGPSPTPSRCRR